MQSSQNPPILSGNSYILNCKEKAFAFATYFADQCKPLNNNSTLPQFRKLTESSLGSINIVSEEITSLIRSLKKGKASGPDSISAHMLLICDDTLTLPLKLIFEQILSVGKYPDAWKIANVTPIFKKVTSSLLKTIDQFHYCLFVANCLKKLSVIKCMIISPETV